MNILQAVGLHKQYQMGEVAVARALITFGMYNK